MGSLRSTRFRFGSVAVATFLAASTGCSSFSMFGKSDPQPETQIQASSWKEVKPTAEMSVEFANLYVTAKNYAAANEHFQKALKQNPKCIGAYVGMGRMYTAQDQPQKAIAQIEAGLKIDPDSGALWNEMAIACMKLEDHSRAISAMEKALKAEPKNENYITNLAGMLAVAGEYERSFETYCKVISPAEARYRIAGVLNAKGNHEESKTQLVLALDDDPQHQKAREMLRIFYEENVEPAHHSEVRGNFDSNIRQASVPHQ